MTTEKLIDLLGNYIKDPSLITYAMENPEVDLTTLGLDSMGLFTLIDDLEDQGVSVAYADFIATPTVAFLLAQGA